MIEDTSWSTFVARTIAELEAEIPIATPVRRAFLRRSIARWKREAKKPAAQVKPQPKRTGKHPVAWRLGAIP